MTSAKTIQLHATPINYTQSNGELVASLYFTCRYVASQTDDAVRDKQVCGVFKFGMLSFKQQLLVLSASLLTFTYY